MAKQNRRKAERQRIARQKAYQKSVKQAKKQVQSLNAEYNRKLAAKAAKQGIEVPTVQPYKVSGGQVIRNKEVHLYPQAELNKHYINPNRYYNVPVYAIDTRLGKGTKMGIDKPLFSLAEQKKLGKSDVWMITEAINKQLDYIRPRNGADGHNFSRAGGNFLQFSADMIFDITQAGMEMGGGEYNPDRKDNPLYMASDFRFDSDEFEKGFQLLSDEDQTKVMRELLKMAGNPYGDEKSYQAWQTITRANGNNLDNSQALINLKTVLDASKIWEAIKTQELDSEQMREQVYKAISRQSRLSDADIDDFNKMMANDDEEGAYEFLKGFGLFN